MDKITPVFVFNSLDVVRGGLTKAVITRANTLINHFDEVVFLTLRFQPNFNTIKEKLYSSGQLDERIKVINFFDDIDASVKEKRWKKRRVSNLAKIKERGYVEFKDKNNALPSYRYYKNGIYVKYKRFDKNNRLIFIDYMNEGRHRLRRDEYNKNGDVVRSRHMDLIKNKPKLDQYLSANGESYLSVWLDAKGSEKRTVFFGDNPKEHGSLYKAMTEWVDEKIDGFTKTVVMSDSRFTDGLVLKLKNKSVKRVAILHNNHYVEPFDTTAAVKKSWAPLFNNIKSFDSIVFLTEEQKNDVTSKYGELNNYKIIPHSAKRVDVVDKISYNPYLAVSLARYSSQKRIDEAIRAFYYVVKEIPEAEYHIYGFGPLKKDLENLITELKLDGNVKLMGFSNNPAETYQSAACSILTSDYEGFGMVLTESLAAGTPVISYDIKYGPKDIIREGIDGFLITKGESEKMAIKIIEIMKNKELREELSHNSKDVLSRFSHDKYVASWLSLFEEVNK